MSVHKDETMHSTIPEDDNFAALLAASSLGAPHVRATGTDIPDHVRHQLCAAAAAPPATSVVLAESGEHNAGTGAKPEADAGSGHFVQAGRLPLPGSLSAWTDIYTARDRLREPSDERVAGHAATPVFRREDLLRRLQRLRRNLVLLYWETSGEPEAALGPSVLQAATGTGKSWLWHSIAQSHLTRDAAAGRLIAWYATARAETVTGAARAAGNPHGPDLLMRVGDSLFAVKVKNRQRAPHDAGGRPAQLRADVLAALWDTDTPASGVSWRRSTAARMLLAFSRSLHWHTVQATPPAGPREEPGRAEVHAARLTDLLQVDTAWSWGTPRAPSHSDGGLCRPVPGDLWRLVNDERPSRAAPPDTATWQQPASDDGLHQDGTCTPYAAPAPHRLPPPAWLMVAGDLALELDPARRQTIPVQPAPVPDLDAYEPRPGTSLLVPRDAQGRSCAAPHERRPAGTLAAEPSSPPDRAPALWTSRDDTGCEQHAQVWMRLHLMEGDLGERVPARLSYRTADRYAVSAVFNEGTGEERRWTFARELLTEGLQRTTGIGDVVVWPGSRNVQNYLTGQRVFIRLRPPEGTVLLSIAHEDLVAFLDASQTLAEPSSDNKSGQAEAVGVTDSTELA